MLSEILFHDQTPGSLSNLYDIKILICCILKEVERPLTRDQINELFQMQRTVNYFNYSQAVSELLKTGHLEEQPNSKGVTHLCITPIGIEAAETLSSSLPPATLEKSIRGMKKLLQEKQENQGKVLSIKEVDDGFLVRLALQDEGSDLLQVQLFAPDREQAERLEKELRQKTTELYRGILAVLFNDHKTLTELSDDILAMNGYR